MSPAIWYPAVNVTLEHMTPESCLQGHQPHSVEDRPSCAAGWSPGSRAH